MRKLEAAIESTTLSETQTVPKQEVKEATSSGQGNSSSVVQEPQKRLRNLRKKLKQIEELQGKLDSGAISELTKEQREKVEKKQTILEEIEDLELEMDDS